MKLLLSSVVSILFLSAMPVLACNNGECDPEPPTHEPEPPAHEMERHDGEPVVTPQYHPCCVLPDGNLKPRWDLFRTPEQVIRACRKALDQGNANIYECESTPSLK